MKKYPLLFLPLLAWVLGCGKAPANGRLLLAKDERPRHQHRTVTNSIGMKLVEIPAGEFLMGSAAKDQSARADEKPRHRVRITRAFYMGVYEVTQKEYRRVMGTNPSFFSPTGPGKKDVAGQKADRFPVEQVSWHDAAAFCRKLSDRPAEKKAGRVYRLPTEAEWEYACRAGTKSAFSVGEALSSRQANFNGNDPFGRAAKGPFLLRSAEVGSYRPNAFGLYDMHGNVWEWCADWYGANNYKKSPVNDPPGPRTGTSRVIRGGGWRAEGASCRSAYRNADVPAGRYYVTGFRVVMTDDSRPNPVVPDESSSQKKEEPDLSQTGRVSPRPRQVSGEDWPRWRGPRGDGTWHGPKLPAFWPRKGLPRLWRQPIGGGYAGVVVSRGRVYTLDHHKKKPKEIERVLCFDAATGKPLWSFPYPVQYGKLEYGNGPRAAPTVHDGRVYALGALGHLHCLDARSGKRLWSLDLVRDCKAQPPLWGCSASPVIFEDLVIVHAGIKDNGCFLALNRKTGKEVWRNLPDPAGYATPIVIQSHGKPQLVCWTPANVRGLEPRTGKLLWTVPFEVTYGTSIATPIFQTHIVLVSGYWEGAKAIRLGKKPTEAKVLWHERRQRALMSQPLYRNGHVYLLDKRQGLTCLVLQTGKKLWDDGNRMTPKGRNPQASMVWLGDGGRVVILNSDGELVLARLDPKGYKEQSRTKIIGTTWAHPAFAGNCVYARNDRELVCVALV
jgi:formylglycine-generating enzyme required for sulfatase activity/outer membrane protein assembly factor BamB